MTATWAALADVIDTTVSVAAALAVSLEAGRITRDPDTENPARDAKINRSATILLLAAAVVEAYRSHGRTAAPLAVAAVVSIWFGRGARHRARWHRAGRHPEVPHRPYRHAEQFRMIHPRTEDPHL